MNTHRRLTDAVENLRVLRAREQSQFYPAAGSLKTEIWAAEDAVHVLKVAGCRERIQETEGTIRDLEKEHEKAVARRRP